MFLFLEIILLSIFHQITWLLVGEVVFTQACTWWQPVTCELIWSVNHVSVTCYICTSLNRHILSSWLHQSNETKLNIRTCHAVLRKMMCFSLSSLVVLLWMLTSYSPFHFRQWLRGRSFKSSFDLSHLKAPCTLWVTCWRKCTRLLYPTTVRVRTRDLLFSRTCVINPLLLAANAVSGAAPLQDWSCNSFALRPTSVHDSHFITWWLRRATCNPDERLSCSCGRGVATMKGEMERLSGSLNTRRLQLRREEVDKETIVF